MGGAIPSRGCSSSTTPPPDSGILGPVNTPDALTVTIAFGASLFDGRYGLAPARPRELDADAVFPVDELDPARSHGDVLLQICASQRDTVVHTVRELLRTVRGSLQLRWTIDGFSAARRAAPRRTAARATCSPSATAPRTPPTTDAALMDELVWAGCRREPGVGRRRHLPGASA